LAIKLLLEPDPDEPSQCKNIKTTFSHSAVSNQSDVSRRPSNQDSCHQTVKQGLEESKDGKSSDTKESKK
jgi:hypothetical protein